MLDRVLSLEPGREGAGLKAVSAADYPVPEGSPTAPALPGALVLQGICALAETVLEEEGDRRPILESVVEATFLRAAQPGEVLTYRVAVEEGGPEVALLRAEATVRGEPVVRARLRYRREALAEDNLTAGWRGLRRRVLSGEDPPTVP